MLKQVIVMRADLGMSKGKMVAQGAHACAGTTLYTSRVCLRVDSEDELLGIIKVAREKLVKCSIVRDAGKTQLEEGTLTCCAIGPDKEETIDTITGHLKLL